MLPLTVLSEQTVQEERRAEDLYSTTTDDEDTVSAIHVSVLLQTTCSLLTWPEQLLAAGIDCPGHHCLKGNKVGCP